ncbi:unnamed protein product [marine sediment metagenome]|uniref:Uncharacterized protein n=1 Tax=marine sediment metagenome TaxID=412755 RepID=X1EKX8_9ZZZZ
MTTNWGKRCSTEHYDAFNDAIALGVVAVLADDMVCLDISAALDGVESFDRVGVEFFRNGDNVADTAGIAYYLGYRIQYV